MALLSGGWVCRAAVTAGLLPGPEEDAAPLRPGWSRGVVIPCPACRNRPYSIAPAGFPWRRCDGPHGCGREWNPEAIAA